MSVFLHRLLLIGAAICTSLPVWSQTLSPDQRGACPVAHTSAPPITASAHFFHPAGTVNTAQIPFQITVWRAPCPGYTDKFQFWLRVTYLSANDSAELMPTFTVYQHGVRLGRFPSWDGSSANNFLIGNFVTVPSVPTVYVTTKTFSISGAEFVAFDPLAAVTLFLEPRDGRWSPQDIRIDVPAADAPGNFVVTPPNVSGLWYNPARSGWGLLLDRNERGIHFAAWMTYDDAGDTTWFVMPSGQPAADGTIVGAVYAPTGKPFSTPAGWSSPGTDLGAPVGQFRIKLENDDRGSFSFDVNGVSRTESFERLIIRSSNGGICNVPVRFAGDGLWYDSTRDGWAVGLSGSTTFSNCPAHFTLLTFDEARKPRWYFAGLGFTGRTTVVPDPTSFSGFPRTYVIKEGTLYRPNGISYRSENGQMGLGIGSPVGHVETRHVALLGARAEVRIGDLVQQINMLRFIFEY